MVENPIFVTLQEKNGVAQEISSYVGPYMQVGPKATSC